MQSDVQMTGQQQCNCSNFVRKVGHENLLLRNQIQVLESEVERMKKEQKLITKAHRIELRWREKKELGIAIFVGIIAFAYVVSALVIRGFV